MKKILIVEDVASDVIHINHELRKGGLSFRSRRVETKEAFLEEIQQNPPDLVLSDHGLPQFDGFTALALARDQCPDVPFIFVTGSRGEEVAIETFESGATDYVLKSRLSTNLFPAVRRALREAEERNRLNDVPVISSYESSPSRRRAHCFHRAGRLRRCRLAGAHRSR